MSALADPPRPAGPAVARGLAVVVGFLAAVEVASGVIQGYYTPIVKDLAAYLDVNDADINWFEAAQLAFSALVVPPLARLGDVAGHRRVLLWSTVVTAIASWGIAFAPGFGTMLVAWAVQGAYVVWLPLEVAIIHRRTAGGGRQAVLTRRATAVLVGVLELSIIVGALTAGLLVDHLSMTVLLALPAVVVTLAIPAILFGVEDVRGSAGTGSPWRGFDWPGLGLLVAAVGLVMGGLIVVRVDGAGSPVAWTLVALGLLALVPWVRTELASPAPMVDVRVLASRQLWPVQVTSFLLGMSLLGAQVPLSTYSRTDPDVAGYGLGVTAAQGSGRIAIYVVCLAVGAALLPVMARLLRPRGAMVLSAVLIAVGYAAWLPAHDDPGTTMLWMAIVGVGSGALVAAIPVAAAAAAPIDQVGSATGLTNAAKTIGGAIASAVFAICLASTGSIAVETGHASLGGYLAVWSICAASGLLAAVLLLLAPGTRVRAPQTA